MWTCCFNSVVYASVFVMSIVGCFGELSLLLLFGYVSCVEFACCACVCGC